MPSAEEPARLVLKAAMKVSPYADVDVDPPVKWSSIERM